MRGAFIHSLRELVLDVRVREALEQRALVLGQIDAMHRPERLDNLEHVRAQKGKHVRVGERLRERRVDHSGGVWRRGASGSAIASSTKTWSHNIAAYESA